jgi:hypothetical protein
MARRKSAILALALWAGLSAPARAETPDSDQVAAGRVRKAASDGRLAVP